MGHEWDKSPHGSACWSLPRRLPGNGSMGGPAACRLQQTAAPAAHCHDGDLHGRGRVTLDEGACLFTGLTRVPGPSERRGRRTASRASRQPISNVFETPHRPSDGPNHAQEHSPRPSSTSSGDEIAAVTDQNLMLVSTPAGSVQCHIPDWPAHHGALHLASGLPLAITVW